MCANPASWHKRITLHRIELHHNPPRSWTRDNGASSTLYPLCGTDHNEVHALLNEYVHAQGAPPAPVLRTYGKFVRLLAVEAWAKRIPDQTPFTMANPDHEH